eukprot:COSAG06_NODE_3039_length_5928_cov_49.157145_7_plen_501_part_00
MWVGRAGLCRCHTMGRSRANDWWWTLWRKPYGGRTIHTPQHIPGSQEVRDFVQQNRMVDNGVLMSYLVRNLNFDKPRDVTLTEQGRVILGNTWSQTMRRLKTVAWGGYGPELDELAVWTRLFNENASNGYAVMRLTRDDKLVVYDGLTQERPEGEFQSFSCVFRPTLMACMRAGVSAISADSTFLPLRPDLNMLVCEGECPSAMSNGLTIVPVANHLCFGESGESYIDMWKFMVDYSDGIAAKWLHGITLHADRGPGGCMASALAHVLPSAIFRSCAFHVWQALERNVPPKDRMEADEITHEVQRCLREVLVKVGQLAKQEQREETKRKREEREEEAQRKRKRDEEARVAKEERRMRNEEVRITKEVTSCLEKLVSTTVRTVETEERAAKRAQEKQARLEEKARAEPARSKAKAVKSTPRNVQQQREHRNVKSTPRNVQQQREHRNVKASRASTSRRAQATPRHEPKPKALPKPKASPQKRPAAVSNDGELWPKYKRRRR